MGTNKIKSLINTNEDITNSLNQKTNIDKRFLNDNKKQKNDFVIYDSGWTATTPTDSLAKTSTKEGYVPEYLSANFITNIKIPKTYIPFLKFEKTVKPCEGTQAVAIMTNQYNTYSGDYIELYGDSTLIYKGAIPIISSTLFTDDQIANGEVNPDYLKKQWLGTFYSTNPSTGNPIKIRASNLFSIEFTEITGTGCDGHPNYDKYIFDNIEGPSVLTDLTNDYAEGTFIKESTVWNTSGGACAKHTTYSTFTGKKYWSSSGTVNTAGTGWEYVAGEWVTYGTGSYVLSPITSVTHILAVGYKLYYEKEFYTQVALTANNIKNSTRLWVDPDHSTHSAYSIYMNPPGFPIYEIPTDLNTYMANFQPYTTYNDYEQILELDTVDGITEYQIKAPIYALIKAPSIVEIVDPTHVYDVLYRHFTAGLNYYILDDSTSSTVPKPPYYKSELADCYTRFRIIIDNPQLYQELFQYEI